MLDRVFISRYMLLLVAVPAFGGASWISGGPAGNAGAWFAVLIALGWPVLSGDGRVPRTPNRGRS